MTNIYEKVKSSINIEAAVYSLLKGGKRVGDNYYPLNPTRSDKTPGSFVIDLRKGIWKDFATGEKGGDIISLYAYVNRCSQFEAAKQLGEGIFFEKRTKSTKTQYIQKLWNEAYPASNTIVEKYLNMRGFTAEIPESIRYHPKVKHIETNAYLPCMIAGVKVWPNDEIVALHRTWLKRDGSGKAEVVNNKKMIGSANGGAIRFGGLGKKLILAEGIETALSVYMVSQITTWAVLSASFMKNLILAPPEELEEVIIAADNDEAGIEAASSLADKLIELGYVIKISVPRKKGADFNDLLNGKI